MQMQGNDRTKHILTTALLAGSLLAPDTVRAQATQPAPEAAPPPPAPAPEALNPAPVQPRDIRFQFDGVPYTEIVRRFAQACSRPLVGDLNIQGNLTFFDSEPYSYDEALDTLNIILAMRGYALIESGRFLQLVQLSNVQRMPLKILRGLDETPDARQEEIVTVVLPLKFVEAEDAARAVRPMVSTFGTVSSLGKGRGIVITDRLSNIQRVRTLLKDLDTANLVERQLRTFTLQRASAREVARIVTNLFVAGRSQPTGRQQQQDPNQPRPAPPPPAVTATFDERSNMVLLVGTGDQLALAEQVIERLDAAEGPAAGEPGAVRVFELENARADEMANTVRQAFPSPTGRDAAAAMATRVVADAGTNRLIISAPLDRLNAIEQLITKLDSASLPAGSVRIFALKSGDAGQLAAIVTNALTRRDAAGRVTARPFVIAEPRTNNLIVSGSAGDVQQAAALIEELDLATAQESRQIHVVQLKAGDARQLAPTLMRLFAQAAGPRQGGTGLRVEAENTTNSLLISASSADWPIVQSILEKLGAAAVITPGQGAPGDAQALLAPPGIAFTRMVKLEHARAAELANTLKQVFQTRRPTAPGQIVVPVVIAASEPNNSLLVSAQEDDQQTIASLVQSMDVPPAEGSQPVRIIRLKSADAPRLAETLRALLPPAPRGQPQPIAIQADPTTNSVLLRAPADQQKALEEMIASLDQSTQEEAREVRTINLRFTSATGLAGTLNQLHNATLPGRRPAPGSNADMVTITAAPGDRTLVIDAPRRKMEQIAQLVAELDRQDAPGAIQVRTYKLGDASAPQVAASLSRLFAQQQRGRPTPDAEPAPRFEGDPATNQVIVSATEAQFQIIDPLVQKLQAQTELSSQTRTFALKFARAQDVVPVLAPMLADAPQARGGRPPAGAPARVAAVAGSNTLIVQGAPAKLALAEQLVATFDVPEAGLNSVIRVVQLEKAQAATLAQSVTASLAPKPGQRVDPAKLVNVTAEPNSNSVLVRGPAEEVAHAVEMIRGLDAGSAGSGIAGQPVQVRIYPLKNAKATELTISLGRFFQDLIRQHNSARRGAEPVPFAVTADDRTNSLVVSTTPAHLALVEQLIGDLDKSADRPAQDVQFITLQNADAFEVAGRLNAMFRDRRLGDRPVIEADSYTNAITVIARDADLQMIEPIVAKIDEASRDTSVQVRVIPLTQVRADQLAEVLRRVYGQMTDSEVIVTDRARDVANPSLLREATTVISLGAAAAVAAQPAETHQAPATQPAPNNHHDNNNNDRPKVVVGVDRSTNSLVISASRQELKHIESLIQQLTLTTGRGDAEYRAFKIQHAEPAAVARTLDDLFNPPPRVIVRQQGQQGQALPPLPPPVITAVADVRTRSLIVRAKPTDFDVIETLVRQLDQDAIILSEVKLFPLKNTDAQEVAANLRELFVMSTGPAPAGGAGGRGAAQQRAQALRQAIRLQGDAGASADTTATVSISANRQTNSVVVAAPADAMQLIARLIEEMDQSAALTNAPSVRLYPVKQGHVGAMAASLQQLFAQARPGQRGAPAAADTPVIISADEAAKLLIVSAPPAKHELIAKVIRDIDAAQGDDVTTVEVYRIEHGQAAGIAAALNNTLSIEQIAPGRGPRGRGPAATGGAGVRITADASTNSLVVRGTQEDHEKIAALLQDLDLAPTERTPVQVIALEHAEAPAVAAVLNRLFASPPVRGARPVSIEADREARMLMVRADAATFEKIRALASQLDAATTASDAQRHIIQLKRAQAPLVAAAVTQAFAPPRGKSVAPEQLISAVAEPSSNSLIVTANAENQERVASLVEKLDAQAAEAGVRSDFLILRHARATDLAAVLARVSAPAGPRGGQAGGVVVTADAGSNALVMSGPAEDLGRAMTMARQLDQASTAGVPGVYIIPLKNGEASGVAQMVRDLYSQQALAARAQQKSVEPLAVTADERANALIVASSKEMYERVAQWVQEVEQMKPARGQLRIVPVQNADPNEVNKAIQDLMNAPAGGGAPAGRGGQRRPGAAAPGRSGGGGGPGGGRVETSVLLQQRAILVNAADEDYEAVLKLVETLDAAAAESKRQVRIFTLKHAVNTRVADALNQALRTPPGTPPAQAAADAVSVTAPPQTNTLVVTARQARLDEVAHLIEQLDRDEVVRTLEFRIFTLKEATPSRILPTLRQMLAEVQRTRPDEPVSVQADDRTRSIIVSARGKVFEQVEAILQTLDRPAEVGATDVLIVRLEKADAGRLAVVLNEMLRPGDGGQITPEARALQEQVRRLRIHGEANDGAAVPELDLTKPIKISADAAATGSNALVIASTPENLQAMKVVVEMMDRVPLAAGVNLRLVRLENADAPSVARILVELFAQGQRLTGRPGQPGAGKAEPQSDSGQALVNPLNVSVDPRTNTIILSGQEASLLLADLVIQDLDRQVGKIVTEVRIFRLRHADPVRMAPVLQSVFAESAPIPGAEGMTTHVTRLRTAIGKASHTTEVPKVRAALSIQSDPTTNSLVVMARSDVMPLIEDVVKAMDTPSAGTMGAVRFYPLAHADAPRVKQVIDAMYAGPAARLTREEEKPTVAVDARTNTLVVSGNDKAFSLVEAMVQQLDSKTPPNANDIRIVQLRNAEATTLAPTLQRMMDARVQRQAGLGARDTEAVRVTISADARSNSLLISGSQEGFDLVKTLLAQLDGIETAAGAQVQLVPLKNANAGTLSQTLSRLFEQRFQATAATAGAQRQRPLVLPDLRSNSLLVALSPDDARALDGLLAKLDVPPATPAVELQILSLKHNDAGVVAPTIRSIFQSRLQSMTAPGTPPAPQDRVDVAFDQLTNALIISASKENLAMIQGLLEKIDIPPQAESGVVRLYPLKNADAQRAATMLQGLISQGLYKPGAVAGAPQAQRERIAITADVRTNVLIVSASKENFVVIEEVLKSIDSAEDFTVLGDVRIYTLTNANVTRLGPTLQQFFNAKRAAEQQVAGPGRVMPVTIIPDARTNTLLVSGSRENFVAIEAMIQKLDVGDVLSLNEFRVFYLKNATAGLLQPTLQQLFDQRALRDVTGRSAATVVADPRTNAMIVSADAEGLEAAAALIQRLDAAAETPGGQVQVFPLLKADALQVANTLRSLYSAPTFAPGTPGQPPRPVAPGAAPPVPGAPGEAAITITADTRLNAVVVSAGAAELERIGELVRQLDGDIATQVTEIKVFPLHVADAVELAQVLTEAMTGQLRRTAIGAPTPARQAVLQFVAPGPGGGQPVATALQEGLLITPDRRTNSLVVSTSVENMRLIEKLIQAIDVQSPQTAQIRVFKLVNAEVRQMAAVLASMFRMTGAPAGRSITYTLISARDEDGAATATIGSAEQAALTVTVDTRTNSLLIGGTEAYVNLASRVIQELDSDRAQERITEVYRMRNAKATDIQAALRSFLDQERQKLVQILGATNLGSAERLLEQEAAVVAEPSSNTLLLSASPRFFDEMSQVIRVLDRAPPQVLIQVLLAEVTLDSGRDLGFEWRYVKGIGGGATANVGTDFGVARDLTRLGGFGVAVTGGDIEFVLRALQTRGKLEVLSRPQILASDNQVASINVGQQVPIIRNSRVSGDTNPVIFNTIEYVDVGVKLDVTPRINDDGLVKLDIAPEISALSTSTVPIQPGFDARIINSRKANTTVTVQDGQTIILGGLITTTDDARESKVPLLGDIPLVGALFRSTKTSKQRTELLVILTPSVVRNTQEADALTETQVKRLNLLRQVDEKEREAVGMPKFEQAPLAPTSRDKDPLVPPPPASDESLPPGKTGAPLDEPSVYPFPKTPEGERR